MSGHTPGPWTRGTNGVSGKNLAICADLCVIGVVYGTGYPLGKGWSPQSDADARLIAAAPDLYDYVFKRAVVGDTEAIALMDKINAAEPTP